MFATVPIPIDHTARYRTFCHATQILPTSYLSGPQTFATRVQVTTPNLFEMFLLFLIELRSEEHSATELATSACWTRPS